MPYSLLRQTYVILVDSNNESAILENICKTLLSSITLLLYSLLTFVVLKQKLKVVAVNFIIHAGGIHQVEVGCAGTEQHVCVLHDVLHISFSKSWSINKCQTPAFWRLLEDWDKGIENEAMAFTLTIITVVGLVKQTE